MLGYPVVMVYAPHFSQIPDDSLMVLGTQTSSIVVSFNSLGEMLDAFSTVKPGMAVVVRGHSFEGNPSLDVQGGRVHSEDEMNQLDLAAADRGIPVVDGGTVLQTFAMLGDCAGADIDPADHVGRSLARLVCRVLSEACPREM